MYFVDNNIVPKLSKHPPDQKHVYLVALTAILAILALPYPFFSQSTYLSSHDLHSTLEMIGAIIGLITGFAFISRFYALGNRFYLFIGFAFFVNASEDFIHGLFAFSKSHEIVGLSAFSLNKFIPGTYVTGRLLMGVILLLSPLIPKWWSKTEDTKHETAWLSLIVLLITMAATATASQLALPSFIYPERLISRPVDFLSAIVFFFAFVIFLRKYHKECDMLIWWITLSIGINVVGQLLMSFSKNISDPFFDIAHLYKVISYAVPLLGFSLYQITIIDAYKRVEERLKEYSEHLEDKVEERTKQLKDTQGELVRKERLAILGQLSGGVGHELRNPLGVISNAIYYLKMVKPGSDEKTKEYMDIISSEITTAEKIVSDLLDFSRINKSEKKNVTVSELISQVLDRQPPPENINVSTEVSAQLSSVFVDSQQIQQVMINLVTNACQAMPEGGNLAIKAQNNSNNVCISVSDSGCGMSSEDRNKIFEPLFTTKARGIGLGLSVTRNLIELNDGSIEVISQEGEGSTFTIHLPIEKAQL